jgi:hypothetical protein
MSPTFLKSKGYRFYTWSKEEARMHIHVVKGKKVCKFWLTPELELADNDGFKEYELNEIKKLVLEYVSEFKSQWQEHFGES